MRRKATVSRETMLDTTGYCALCNRWRRLMNCDLHDQHECRQCKFSPRHKTKLSRKIANEVTEAFRQLTNAMLSKALLRELEADDSGTTWLEADSHDDRPRFSLLMTKNAIHDLESLTDKVRQDVERYLSICGWKLQSGVIPEFYPETSVYSDQEPGPHVLLRWAADKSRVTVLRILDGWDELDEDIEWFDESEVALTPAVPDEVDGTVDPDLVDILKILDDLLSDES